MKYRNIILSLLLFFSYQVSAKEIVWFDGQKPVSYNVLSTKNEVVESALRLFEDDMKLVTGKAAVQSNKATIEIYQLDQLKDKFFSRLEHRHLPVSDIIAHHGSYAIACYKGRIMVLGSDSRGTAYGILHLSQLAGVSPWTYWGDIPTARKKHLSLDDSLREIFIPSVEWRGLLLNDPASTLSHWSRNALGESVEPNEIGPQAWQHLFELMMRLRLNCIELATPKEAEAFYSHRKNISTANDCGIVVWADNKVLKKAKHGSRQENTPEMAHYTPGKNRLDVHLSHSGGPSEWVWSPTASPGMLVNEMREAWNGNIRQLWMAEIHEPKLTAPLLSMFSDMAWNHELLLNTQPKAYLKAFMQYHFNKKTAQQIVSVMSKFHRLCAIRRPEYMRWPAKESMDYKSSGEQPSTVFNPGEFGNELGRYLQQWRSLALKTQQLGKQVPKDQRDAYFAWIEYPVCAAMQVAVKELEAQESRQISRKETFHHDEEALEAAANATMAYRKLYQLTDHFNKQLAKGRWNGLVQIDEKRSLSFSMPALPDELSEKEITQYHNENIDYYPLRNDLFVARNACQYDNTEGTATPLEMTGHSGTTMLLSPNSSLKYEFTTTKSGEALLYMAFVPLQHRTSDTLRYAVSIDGQEPIVVSQALDSNSAAWLQAVIRGQIVSRQRLTLEKGKHTLSITALEQSIIADQWLLDFDLNRSFYTIPVTTADTNP